MRSILWSIHSFKNKVSADQYHMTVFTGSSLELTEVTYFLKFTADQVLDFIGSQAQLFLHII